MDYLGLLFSQFKVPSHIYNKKDMIQKEIEQKFPTHEEYLDTKE